MEEKKYYIIKVDNFYLREFRLNDEDVKTHFVHGIEFITAEGNAYTFNDINDANMMQDLLVKLGFVSCIVDEIII